MFQTGSFGTVPHITLGDIRQGRKIALARGKDPESALPAMCQVHLRKVFVAPDVGHLGDVKLTHLQKVAYVFIFGA